MSATELERSPAKSIEALDLHLFYLQRQVAQLVDALPLMATKADIDNLARRLEGYATQDEVRTLRVEVDAVRKKVESGSVEGTLKKWAEWAQRLSAIAAFLAVVAAACAYLVHLTDRLPTEPVKVTK